MPDRDRDPRARVPVIAERFELVRELGAEGDALLWEGFDVSLERRVLVQLLRQELAQDRVAVERFWQAARQAARSSAAAGQRVLDAGTDPASGRSFVVREWPVEQPAIDLSSKARPMPALLNRPRGPFHMTWKRMTWKPGNAVTAGRIALLGLIVVAVVGHSAVWSVAEAWLAWVNAPLGRTTSNFVLPPVQPPPAVGAQPGQASPTPVEPPPTVTAGSSARNAAATPAPTSASGPRPTSTLGPTSGVPRRIVNTDGLGVALRASAGGNRLPGKGYDEGVTVQAFESSGAWTRIRGRDGREGWVPTVTLAP